MVVAILQARMSSSRLPGKVLRPILGRPMLQMQLERVRRAKWLQDVVVATSDQSSDDPLQELCVTLGIRSFRGHLDDVLDRFYRAALTVPTEYVVRLTGDCPLADWAVIDRAIETCVSAGYDYVGNGLNPTYPDGLDVEVMRMSALTAAWQEAKLPSEREHVTPFIYKNAQRFRLFSLENEVDLSALRWTVDEEQDLRFVQAVYGALYPSNPSFGMQDILELLHQRPDIAALSGKYRRNEGYEKSLVADRGSPKE